MKALVDSLLRPFLAATMAVVVANCNEACKPAESPIGPLDAPYAAETLACSESAKSPVEASECRKKVNWKYGLCPDDAGWGVKC